MVFPVLQILANIRIYFLDSPATQFVLVKKSQRKKNDNEPLQEPTGIFWGKRLKDDDMHTLQ